MYISLQYNIYLYTVIHTGTALDHTITRLLIHVIISKDEGTLP